MTIGINSLLVPLPREHAVPFCQGCGYEDARGVACRSCGTWFCRSCIARSPMGDAMEALEACGACLQGRVLEQAAALDELSRDNVAELVAAEILEGRA